MHTRAPFYTVTEHTPSAGSVTYSTYSEVATVAAAAADADDLYEASITNPRWNGGYVVAWSHGGASAKGFDGCDQNGFGGDIPADALDLVKLLDH